MIFMVENESNEEETILSVLKEIRDELQTSNDLKVQELEMDKNRDELYAAFIRIATHYSVMGMNLDVQQSIVDKIENQEKKIEEYTILERNSRLSESLKVDQETNQKI